MEKKFGAMKFRSFQLSFSMDDMSAETTRLRASLTCKIREILRDSSIPGVLKEEVIQVHILHKARYE